MTEKKVLNIDAIESSAKSFEDTKVIEFEIEGAEGNETYTLEVYEKFSDTKIANCMSDYVETLDAIKKINRNLIEKVSEPMFMFMVVKHFTKLDVPAEWKMQLKLINYMIDTKALQNIVIQLDQNEVKKVVDFGEKLLEKLVSNLDVVDELKEEYRDKLADKSLLD